MRKTLFCTLMSFMMMQSGFALLPPYYQSLSELTAILKDPRLNERLDSGEAILSIQRNDHGYLITTPKHQLQVDITYQTQEHPGPAKFDLQFRNPIASDSAK